ncbi:MAG: ABC transporter substrate-binding protein, partial [Rhodospirillales bacterium]|nr:ABC transporter substrate-binding protein [Rhodospirillales bacterium]
WIEINHRVKPLDDARVRQAISHALDRNFILNKLWFGIGKVATGPIVSTTRYYDASVAKLQPYNLEKAKALLDEAGLKPNASGVRFPIKHLALPYGEVWMRLAEYFRTSLRKIGIEVVLETTDAGAWAKRIGDWDYETSTNFVSQFGDPTLGVERTYVSTNIKKVTFTNTGGYANPKIDALFKTARDSGDSAVRAKAFTEIQQILCEEIPQIWLMEMQWPTTHEKKLHNVIRTAMGPNAGFGQVFFG